MNYIESTALSLESYGLGVTQARELAEFLNDSGVYDDAYNEGSADQGFWTRKAEGERDVLAAQLLVGRKIADGYRRASDKLVEFLEYGEVEENRKEIETRVARMVLVMGDRIYQALS